MRTRRGNPSIGDDHESDGKQSQGQKAAERNVTTIHSLQSFVGCPQGKNGSSGKEAIGPGAGVFAQGKNSRAQVNEGGDEVEP